MGIKGLIPIAKMKASFKNERKKKEQKRETAEQQLLVYISNERQ